MIAPTINPPAQGHCCAYVRRIDKPTASASLKSFHKMSNFGRITSLFSIAGKFVVDKVYRARAECQGACHKEDAYTRREGNKKVGEPAKNTPDKEDQHKPPYAQQCGYAYGYHKKNNKAHQNAEGLL